MAKQELGGNIILSNFEMEGQEMIIIKKIVGNYAEKIRHTSDYDEIRLEMKTHNKGKTKLFEINGCVFFKGEQINSNAEGFNPFILLDEVLKKILNETEHRFKVEK